MTLMARPSPRPRPDQLPAARPAVSAVDVHADGGDPLTAMKAAVAVYEMARDKGLPEPIDPPAVVGGRIEVPLLWPSDLLRWVGVLKGLGYADEREHRDFDAATEDIDERRVQALPHHQRGDLAVHGWTETDTDGGRRHKPKRQQWVLRPVVDADSQRHLDLPEPTRPPLSVDGWAAQRWFELTGRRWDCAPVTGPIPVITAEAAR